MAHSSSRLPPTSNASKRTKPAQPKSRKRMHLERLEARQVMAAPQLAAVLPFEATAPLSSQPVRNEAPQELTFRFDQGQVINPATLATGIRLVGRNVDGNDAAFNNVTDQIIPGFLGIGQQPNEVVMRFSTPLLDDVYRIDFIGTGAGALANMAGEPIVSKSVDFELDLAPQVVAVVPQPISRGAANSLVQARNQIVVYFNNDDLRNDSASATNTNFYTLIFTNGTATNTDDSPGTHPTSVAYNATTDSAVLTFANDLALLGPGNSIREGTYRLRIGNDFVTPAAPVVLSENDLGSSIATAQTVTLTNGQTTVVNAAIDAERFKLSLPGSDSDPGHEHLLGGGHVGPAGDGSDGITTQAYTFTSTLSASPDGNSLVTNIISETQKQRAREAFELWGKYLGIQFYETSDQADPAAWVIATSDLKVLTPPSVSSPNDGILYAIGTIPSGQTALVLDRAEISGQGNPNGYWANAEFGGNYFEAMVSGIGALMGLQPTNDLPPLNAMGSQFGGISYGGSVRPTPDRVADADFGNYTVERSFPSVNDIIHGQYLFRPESKDIDVYSVNLVDAGTIRLETVAERLADSSLLNTVISVFNSSGQLIARNDDYFSDDSFLELNVGAGTYYVAVSSTGNTDYDLGIEDSGFGGTTQGDYQLRMNFTKEQTTGIVDKTGQLLDGDFDGKAGGAYNFWFNVATQADTIYVDKASTGSNLGTLANPYKTIPSAFAAATPGKVVRIVGNGSAATLTTNKAYEIGQRQQPSDPQLSDGTNFFVPKGVTVMIDAGAIFKLRRTNIDVGSPDTGSDLAGGALQVLGIPGNSVYFTSYMNESIGNDALSRVTSPTAGDWGGLIFFNKADYESSHAVAETQGIFLNYVNHADVSYGGGTVSIGGVDVPFDPITLVESRPTLSFNRITNNSNSAISADPNSFEESRFYDLANTYELAYSRIGPDIVGNYINNNTINGLFVRIKTDAGRPIDVLTKQARLNDNIVTVLTETLLIDSTPGGPLYNQFTGLREARLDARLRIDPGMIVKLDEGRIETDVSATLIAEGSQFKQVIFTSLGDNRYGASGTFDTAPSITATRAPGDWGGIYFHPGSSGSFDYAFIGYAGGINIIEGDTARFNALEIHNANVRLANSELTANDVGGDVDTAVPPPTSPRQINNRNGRGWNKDAVIFVRGAQPVLINNRIHDNNAPAISIDINSMIAAYLEDPGRMTVSTDTKTLDQHTELRINQGPLVSGNRTQGNTINGMVIRGGILTTESVWDDTDITHVVDSEILDLNFHTYGGLRLESRPSESLVVKFMAGAGLTAAGVPMDLADRIGGSIQIVGYPNQPVVLTSIHDDTVGAGLDLIGHPQFDTNNNGNATVPTAGDWRSIRLDKFSNDRNVEVHVENEAFSSALDVNGTPDEGETLGELGQNSGESDDLLRQGFVVQGYLATPSDVDVYGIKARPGTEVWLDIDRTRQALDVVVELLNSTGQVLARSDNSYDESRNPSLFATYGVTGNLARILERSVFNSYDNYTTNTRDAGMRIVLPGPAGGTATNYYIRVRASQAKTYGQYQLQVRLQQQDEAPGSIISSGDIRYATNAIEVFGKPTNSPLIGEVAEAEPPNAGPAGPVDGANVNNIASAAQVIGNLTATNRAALSIAGSMNDMNDVDWYQFQINDASQIGTSGVLSTVFDIDYAGEARPDFRVSVFTAAGQLIYTGDDSNVTDDLGPVLNELPFSDISRGSTQPSETFLGPVTLPLNTLNNPYYLVAVSHTYDQPLGLSANNLARLEPIRSLVRIAEDHIGFSGGQGSSTLYSLFNPLNLNAHASAWNLGDVTLYVNTDNDLFTVNPYTGYGLYDVTGAGILPNGVAQNYHDIAMRSDGRLYTLTVPGAVVSNALVGNFIEINTADGTALSNVDDQIVPYTTSNTPPATRRDPKTGNLNLVASDVGVRFEAMAIRDDGARKVYAVGNLPFTPADLISRTTNLLYVLNANGVAIDDPNDPKPDDANSPTDVRVGGELFTGPTILPPRSTDVVGSPFNNPGDIKDGSLITITDVSGDTLDFEFDAGIDLDVGPFGAEAIRDGNTFTLSDGVNPDKVFEFNSGPVVDVQAGVQDGDTITIRDNSVPAKIITFEFDGAGGPAGVAAGATPVAIGATHLATIGNLITAINGAAFAAKASASNNPLGRISIVNDSVAAGGVAVFSPTSNVTVSGDYQTNPANIRIDFEETQDFDGIDNATGLAVTGFGQSVETAVESAFSNLINVGYAERQGATNTDYDRLNFYNAKGADITNTSGFRWRNDVNGNPSATGIDTLNHEIAIPFDAGMDSFQVAAAITTAVNQGHISFPAFTATASQSGDQVQLNDATTTPTATAPVLTTGNGPGGTITGMAWLGNTLYAVSDTGGLYIVNNPDSYQDFTAPDFIPIIGTGPTLQYVTTSANLIGIQFSGLSAGPQHVEGGLYANMLFATDTAGRVYAINAAGARQPVFDNGATSIATGIANARGLAFSTLDYNLFHASDRRATDLGHGLNYNNPLPPDGSQQYYFGLEPGQDTSYQPRGTPFGPDGNPALYGTYNLPGGAHGNLITNTFSLKNYSAADQPFLYFNYFYASEAAANWDTANVYISNDGANWSALSTPLLNPLTRNSGGWLQKKLDLSLYAGQDNLRLRFDYYTSGDSDTGVQNNTGSLLHAVKGSLLTDGDTFTLSNGTRTFEFDMGYSLITPVGAGALNLDGQSFTIGARVFEFDKGNGLVNAAATPVTYDATMSAADLADAIAVAVNAALGNVQALAVDNRVQLVPLVAGAASVVTTSAGSFVTRVGSVPGVGTIPGATLLYTTITATENQIASLIGSGIDAAYVPAANNNAGYLQVAKVYQGTVQVIGHNITGVNTALGQMFSSSFLPGDPLVDQATNRASAQNNNFEGFYIDDVTIGFAERGEVVFNAGLNTAYPVRSPIVTTANDDGTYDLEIRAATRFDNAFRGMDTNDRLRNAFYLYAPAGVEIQEGESFAINDGTHVVTFEFDSNNTLINPAAVRVPYTATMTDKQVAAAIATAIGGKAGGVFAQGVSFKTGNPNPAGRLNTLAQAINSANWVLLNDAVAIDLFSSQVTARPLTEIEGTNDTLGSAVDSGLSSATPGTYIQDGRIGDNPTLSTADAGLDVDFIKVQMNAGETLEVDIDSDPYVQNFDSYLRIFGPAGVVMSGSIDPANDVDMYSFGAVPGTRLWASVDTGGTSFFPANSQDSILQLLAANGTTVLESDDDDGTGNGADSTVETGLASIITGRRLTTAATNYLSITGFGPTDVIDPYTLYALTTSPDQESPEVEGNNTALTSTVIVNSVAVKNGAINVAGDVDYYSFQATAGDTMFIAADGDPERDGVGTDVTLELLASDGTTVLMATDSSGAGNAANPAGEGFSFQVSTTGTYYVRVLHASAAGTGTYDLMVANMSQGGVNGFETEGNDTTATANALDFTPELTFNDDGRARGEVSSFDSYRTFTAPTTGVYYVGISGFPNTNYDNSLEGSGVAGTLGTYKVRMNVGVASSLRYEEYEFRGDSNTSRDQGVTIIRGNQISNSSGYGILVASDSRDATGSQTFPGASRNLTESNSARAVPGVTLVNNVISFVGTGGIHISGDANAVATDPIAPAPLVRVVNNTIYGDLTAKGIGVQIDQNATPSLLNNVLANLAVGINQQTGVGAAGTVDITGSAYAGNTVNTAGIGLESDPIQILPGEPLFVDPASRNFYPSVGSKIVDSAITTLPERAELHVVKSDLGIADSPLKMPETDALGQQRRDTSEANNGQGDKPFNDRGAIERADTTSPTIQIITPADNDAGGLDVNPAVDIVRFTGPAQSRFVLQLVDGVVPFNAALGTGVDDTTVAPAGPTDGSQFVVTRNGAPLVQGVDYIFAYNSVTNQVSFEPLTGFFGSGTYVITVNNSAATGIKDLAGNSLQANQANGTSLFLTIIIPAFRDYGDAPAPYPTLAVNNGPAHDVDGATYLGAGVSVEGDGQPSSTASGDGGDDGVTFNTGFFPGLSANMTVLASTAGLLQAWIDWNHDGDWTDPGEQVATNLALVAGPNTVTVTVPTIAQGLAAGQTTFARFRFSTQAGLGITGTATNGEVEDYAIALGNTSPWQPIIPFDANGNGVVTLGDLSVISQELRERNFSSATTQQITAVPIPGVRPPPYIDIDGDNMVTLADLVSLSNYLHGLLPPGSGEAPASSPPHSLSLPSGGSGEAPASLAAAPTSTGTQASTGAPKATSSSSSSSDNDAVFSAWGVWSGETTSTSSVPATPAATGTSNGSSGSVNSSYSLNQLLSNGSGATPTVFWEDVSDEGSSAADTLFADMAREQKDPLETATGSQL